MAGCIFYDVVMLLQYELVIHGVAGSLVWCLIKVVDIIDLWRVLRLLLGCVCWYH